MIYRKDIIDLISGTPIGHYSDWYVFYNNVKDKYWLGIRTHDMVGTDYYYMLELSKDESFSIINTIVCDHFVYDFCNKVMDKKNEK